MRAYLTSLAGLVLSAGVVAAADTEVDYVKDVKPILAKACYSCHGSGRAKGGVRVDTRVAMIQGGAGALVFPGKSKDSPLIHSFTGEADVRRMPPRGNGLSKDQIDLVKKWVDAGAKGPADEKPEAAATGPGDRDRRRRRRDEMRKEMEKKEAEKKEAEKKEAEKKEAEKKEAEKKKDDTKKGDEPKKEN